MRKALEERGDVDGAAEATGRQAWDLQRPTRRSGPAYRQSPGCLHGRTPRRLVLQSRCCSCFLLLCFGFTQYNTAYGPHGALDCGKIFRRTNLVGPAVPDWSLENRHGSTREAGGCSWWDRLSRQAAD
jgi:hypothetical protein